MNKKLSFLLVILVFSSISFSQWELVNNKKGYSYFHTCYAKDSVIAFNVYNTGKKYLRVSIDNGVTWIENETPQNFSFTHLSIYNAQNIWGCTGDGYVYFTSDLGKNWVTKYDDEQDTFLDYIKFFDENNGVVVGDSPDSTKTVLVLNTSDGGKTWESVNDTLGVNEASYGTHFPISFPSKNVGFYDLYRRNKLYKTEDGGATWVDVNFPDKNVYFIEFYNEEIGYAVSGETFGDDKKIYKTVNGGDTWELKSVGHITEILSLEIVPQNPDNIWLLDYDELFYSSNSGETLTKVDLGTNTKNDPQTVNFVSNSTGYVVTDSAYVFKTVNNGGFEYTSFKEIRNIPNGFTLHQNYPNPFNPTTNIEFDLSQESSVNLSVYDLLGNKVEDIYKGRLEAGNYVFQFNGENLSSAIYLFKLKVGENTQTRKMMLLK